MGTNDLSVVVFSNNGIGDFWLSLPALRAILSSCRELFLIAPPKHLSVLPTSVGCAIKSVALRDPFRKAELFSREEIESLQSRVRCDILVSMATYESASFRQLVQALKPTQVYGYFDGDVPCKASANDQHMGELLFHVARCALRDQGLDENQFRTQVRGFAEENERRAARIVSHLGADRKLIAVHSEASEAGKCLSSASVIAALTKLIEHYPQYAAVVVNPTGFCGDLGDLPIFDLSGLTLASASALVSRAHLALTVDSCFRHQLDSLDIPTVAVYGPTSPRLWGRRHGRGIDLKFDSMEGVDVGVIADSLLRLAQQETLESSPATIRNSKPERHEPLSR